jgi:hypothetical protein
VFVRSAKRSPPFDFYEIEAEAIHVILVDEELRDR